MRTAPRAETHDLEAVLATVRALWTAADQSDPQLQAWLQKAVVDGVERIKRQVQGRLKIAAITSTPPTAANPLGSANPPKVGWGVSSVNYELKALLERCQGI